MDGRSRPDKEKEANHGHRRMKEVVRWMDKEGDPYHSMLLRDFEN